MLRTPPTLDHLKEVGLKMLEEGKRQLTETKSLLPVVVLGDAMDGERDLVVAIEPNMMNSSTAKFAATSRIKQEIAKHGYAFSITVVDTFHIVIPREKAKQAIRLKRLLGLSVKQMADAGLGELRECLSVMVETMDRSLMINVTYSRDEEGSVSAFGGLETLEDAVEGGLFRFFNNE